MKSYFNVHSKAGITYKSANLPHGTKNEKAEKNKTKK